MNKICENCKIEFSCESSNPKQSCWCFSLPVIKLPKNKFKDCLCKNCLLSFQNESDQNLEAKAIMLEEDYYFENGLMVLTETFLKKRGFCCKNGCRHCPY